MNEKTWLLIGVGVIWLKSVILVLMLEGLRKHWERKKKWPMS